MQPCMQATPLQDFDRLLAGMGGLFFELDDSPTGHIHACSMAIHER
jgi:hypothetical protein